MKCMQNSSGVREKHSCFSKLQLHNFNLCCLPLTYLSTSVSIWYFPKQGGKGNSMLKILLLRTLFSKQHIFHFSHFSRQQYFPLYRHYIFCFQNVLRINWLCYDFQQLIGFFQYLDYHFCVSTSHFLYMYQRYNLISSLIWCSQKLSQLENVLSLYYRSSSAMNELMYVLNKNVWFDCSVANPPLIVKNSVHLILEKAPQKRIMKQFISSAMPTDFPKMKLLQQLIINNLVHHKRPIIAKSLGLRLRRKT